MATKQCFHCTKTQSHSVQIKLIQSSLTSSDVWFLSCRCPRAQDVRRSITHSASGGDNFFKDVRHSSIWQWHITKNIHKTHKEWKNQFALWDLYSFAYFSLTGHLDDMKIVNLQHWELVRFSEHQRVIQWCWQVLLQDVSNQCLKIKCNYREWAQQNINSKSLSRSLLILLIFLP